MKSLCVSAFFGFRVLLVFHPQDAEALIRQSSSSEHMSFRSDFL